MSRKKGSSRRRSQRQKSMRRRRGENAYLFDAGLTRLLVEVDRDDWELATAAFGGDIRAAAHALRLEGIPASAKVLWGRSAEHAADTYRAWRNRKAKRKGRKR